MAKPRALAKQSPAWRKRKAAKRGLVADQYPHLKAGIAIPRLRGNCTKMRNFCANQASALPICSTSSGHDKNHHPRPPIAASRRWRNVLRLKSEPGATRMTLLREKQVTGPISCVLCTILPWLTVLSIAPAFLLLVACKFSHKCWLHGFMWGMAEPGLPRTLAIAMVLGPLLVLLTYAFAFLNCRRPRDAVDRGGRSFG
jgi:hypothetical protein